MSKGKETRQRIVAEAAALFNQRGFQGASLAALMQATGLEKGGIYRHFESKEALAAEAFDFAWRAAADARTLELDSIPNSVDKLKQFVANFVERRSPIPGGCPLLNSAVDSDDGNSVLRERAAGALHEWIDTLISIIRSGIRKREISRRVDSRKLAILIISCLEGALMIARLEHDKQALQLAQTHLQLYLDTQVRLAKRVVLRASTPGSIRKNRGRSGLRNRSSRSIA